MNLRSRRGNSRPGLKNMQAPADEEAEVTCTEVAW